MAVVRCEKVLEDLEASAKLMKEAFSATGEAITDEEPSLQTFCVGLEKVLRHGQKDKVTLFGGSKDYWNYLQSGAEGTRAFSAMLRNVQSMSELKTSQGRGRAFLRLALVEHSLADALQLASSNTKLTNECYHQEAIFRSPHYMSRLLDLAYSLNDLQFSLPNRQQHLDVSWPTFSRRVLHEKSAPKSRRRKVKTATIASVDSGSDDCQEVGNIRDSLPPEVLSKRTDTDSPASPRRRAESGAARTDILDASDSSPSLNKDEGQHGNTNCTEAVAPCVSARVDDSAWESFHQMFHRLILNESENLESSGRVEEVHQLVQEVRSRWTEELVMKHEQGVKELALSVTSLEEQCSGLRQQLDARQNDNLQLAAELSAVRKENETRAAGHDATVEKLSDELSLLRNELDSERKRRESAERVHAQLKADLAEKDDALRRKAEETCSKLDAASADVEHIKEELVAQQAAAQREDSEWRSRLASLEEQREAEAASALSAQGELQNELGSLRRRLLTVQELISLHISMGTASASDGDWIKQIRAACDLTSSAPDISENFNVSENVQQSVAAWSLQRQLAERESEKRILQQRLEHFERQSKQWELQSTSLRADREQLEVDKQALLEKLSQQRASAEREITGLEDQLLAATRDRDAERASSLRLSSQLETVTEQCLRGDQRLHSMQEDLETTREQLLLVSQQKADWVNRTAKLEDDLVSSAAMQWVADEDVSDCMQCKVTFTFFVRKHHCRNCGRVFCHNCCYRTFMLAASSKPSRVCTDCYDILTSRSQGVTEPIRRIMSNESFAVVSNNASPSPALVQSSLHGSEDSLASVTAGGKIVLGDSGDEDVERSADVSAMLAARNGRAVSPPIAAPQRTAVADSSSAEPSPSSLVNPALLRARRVSGQLPRSSPRQGPSQNEQQLCEVLDLSIKPGRYHMVPVLVESPGLQLSWQFQTEPKGISFGMAYKKSDMSDSQSAVTLVPLRRMGSHKQIVSGDWMAQNAGIYTLQFDNTASTVTSCKLSYKILLKHPNVG